MILITGAGGKTGRAICDSLIANRVEVRAMVRTASTGPALKDLGVTEIIVGDMTKTADMQCAFQGVRSVYHICPNVSPDEVLIGQVAIQAASEAGVEHFVYHSVLHPQIEAMPHHWLKLRVEEKLFESGLAFTILQPTAYMQNILAYWQGICDDGVFTVPYSGDARSSMVDLQDVAQAALRVLTESGHEGAIYELCGGEVFTQNEIAGVLSSKLQHPVRVEKQDLADWETSALASGMGIYQLEALLGMFRYYDRYGFSGNSKVLSWLLGREPATFAEFVDRVLEQS
jgi:NAD(P)H dehydrogenase (quinone)